MIPTLITSLKYCLQNIPVGFKDMSTGEKVKYDLLMFSAWLQTEARCQPREEIATSPSKVTFKSLSALTTILHGANKLSGSMPSSELFPKPRATCAYCNSFEHHVSKCAGFIDLTKDQKITWIKENKRCWLCAHSHQAAKYDLKKFCATCKGRHLQYESKIQPSCQSCCENIS